METEIKYITTKQECQNRINELNHVCDGCGGVITPFETVYNSDRPTFWSGCETCQKFTSGVAKEVYLTAKDMVQNQYYLAYSYMDRPTEKSTEGYREYYEHSQISGATSVVRQVLQTYNKITKS